MPQPPSAGDIQTRDAIYCRNMAALFRADGKLAQRIDEATDDGSVVLESAKRGGMTASVIPPRAERRVYVHSRIDPQGEAERFAARVDLSDDFCYVVSGFGLGYHIRALYDRLKGDAFIIVTEPNIQLLRAAMETVDLSDIIAADKCIILTRPDKGEVQTRLEPHNTLILMGAQFIAYPTAERIHNEFHAAMRKLIADHLTYCRMSIMTLVANSRITARNVLNNLPTYVSTPPIDPLRDRFKNKPAILVAAGPSLRKNIDQLAELKGKAVIISVQTTFKTLLDRGIEPDFVTTLDYHKMSKRFFENIDTTPGTHMVAEPKVTWHVLDTYKGPVSLLNNDFARLCVGDDLAARGALKAGATVAHLSLYLAAYMGCNPIVLVGQDLGYSNHVYYTPGVAMHDTWRPELNRFCTIEMKEWERIARFRNILMKVKDINGHDIYTDEQLFTYLQQFEGDFSAIPMTVIDATEGGVRKAGTEVMTLADVARQYCREPIDPTCFAYREQLNRRDHSRLEKAGERIKQRLADVDVFIADCKKMIAVLDELTRLLERPNEFNRRLADVDALRFKIRQQDHTYRMVSTMCQHAELQRFSADRKLSLADVDSMARAKRQLERDMRFVEAVIEGGDALKEILEESLQRFEQAIATGQQAEG